MRCPMHNVVRNVILPLLPVQIAACLRHRFIPLRHIIIGCQTCHLVSKNDDESNGTRIFQIFPKQNELARNDTMTLNLLPFSSYPAIVCFHSQILLCGRRCALLDCWKQNVKRRIRVIDILLQVISLS